MIKRTFKRIKRKTPGGKLVLHYKKRKVGHAFCGMCGAKLNRPKLTRLELKTLPKTKKRSERPLPNLCPKCMREYFKNKVRK